MSVELQSVFRIWADYHEPVFLEVFVDGDGMLCIKTTDKKSEEYFGKIYFTIGKDVASKLAEALKVLT